MSWREELRRVQFAGRAMIGASFRGVPFFVESTERSGGRRTVSHEFPQRDTPYVEDLGRRAGTHRFDGYVIGDDYIAQRDALQEALESQAGPGELVHPSYGTISAICTGLSVRESRTEGGWAQLGMEFAETPAQSPSPEIVVDEAATVSASAAVAKAATSVELDATFSAAGLPAYALASTEAAIRSAAEQVRARLEPLARTAQELATFSGRIRLITSQASSLARQPAQALAALDAAIVGLGEAAADAPGDVLDALLGAYGFDEGPAAPLTTATRRRERANQLAITGALRRNISIEAARLATSAVFASSDEALAARDRVAALLEEQAGSSDDAAYLAISTLRADLLRAVPGSSLLARVVTVARRVPIPSILLAYQLYGETSREDDVIDRNRIRNPSVVSGDLEVLGAS